MAKALVERGASRTARDSWQRIPLHDAAGEGNLSCVVLLVGRLGKFKMTPAEVNAAERNGNTALHLAAAGGHEKVCGVLIQAGARLDASNSDDRTPLRLAQQMCPGNAALHALLSGGGGPAQQLPGTVCDHCGKTAAEAAVPYLKSCGSCFEMRYCGAACSVAAWPGHKAACKEKRAEREMKTKVALLVPVPVQ